MKIKHAKYVFRMAIIALLCCMTGKPDATNHHVESEHAYEYPQDPFPDGYIPPVLKNPSIVTSMKASEILRQINIQYEAFYDLPAPNNSLKRLHHLMLTYDQISKLRYRRAAITLSCQKSLPDLIDFLLRTKWYNEFLIPISSNDIYDFSETTALRILISAHTAAHFFQIPFPTLFCLIFQESRFDFKIKSYTGALGLGQITSIALKQINLIRKNDAMENRRLMAASRHIQNIYADPVIDEILRAMGFYPMFPNLGTFPKIIQKFDPFCQKVVKQVGLELVKKNILYGSNLSLVRRLIQKNLKGQVLRGKEAAVHPALLKVIDVNYGKEFGTVLNIETNLLVSAMLLRHYINYEWTINNRKLILKPSLAAIMAIAAYNQGPSVVRKYLRHLLNMYPTYKIEQSTAKDHNSLLSRDGIQKALSKKSRRVDELFAHIRKISRCSEGDDCH